MKNPKTDLDLAPAYRTQANMYCADMFKYRIELQKANKGLCRLRAKLDRALKEESAETATKIASPKLPCDVCGDYPELKLMLDAGNMFCSHCGRQLQA